MTCPTCNYQRAKVGLLKATVYSAARRAAATELPQHIAEIARAKNELAKGERTASDHWDGCTWQPPAPKPAGLAADDHRHGTHTGYNAGCRCDPCRTAAAAYRAAKRPATRPMRRRRPVAP